MNDSTRTPRRKTILYGSSILILLLFLLLLLRQCRRPDGSPFDYFRAKAAELGGDPGRVARYVADEVKTLPYSGNVKGALATLWEGAGSPQEKAALSDALLAHCAQGQPSVASKDPVLSATLLHRGASETVVYEGPIGDLVGDVHSIETVAPGKSRVTIRARVPIVKELESGGEREEILFRVQRPGGETPHEILRELWHKDNRVGPIAAMSGDRHDFVVLPCRVGTYVREKEEQRLRERGRDKAEEASGYLTLLDYCLRSDRALADLERDLRVRARFDAPRILMLSRARIPGLSDGALALDLRLNRVTFDGASKSDAHLATQIRSFVESGLEQHFLTKVSGQPCSSTYDLFNRLHDDLPKSYDRRLALMLDALEGLGDGGHASFRARKEGPIVTVTKDGGKFRLAGARIKESFVQSLKLPDPPIKPEDAALAVELALMSSGATPDYLLDVVEVSRAEDSLVTEGATFTFRWGEGADRTDQRIRVDSCAEHLGLSWRVQTGVRPARGNRVVTRRALQDAAIHNPWYATGDDEQDDATSFCVSRKVFEGLRSGRPVDLALQGAYRPEDDPKGPRPIVWKGQATRAGEGSHRTLVNGREEELRFLKAKIGGADVAILDDARFPVGMADKIVEIRTIIRVRLVDESGVGIAGALVEAAGKTTRKTGPDGRFLLPPMSGMVKLIARRGDEVLGEQEVDLTAPGRSEVRVTVPRKRAELLFVTKDNAGELDPLQLSAQARRHLARHLQSGYQIVIPNRKVKIDGADVIAYYAHEVATGEIIGVTEEGLHGSAAAYRRALASLARDLADNGNNPVPFAHVHMMRGAIIAWWVYSKERVGGAEHEEAINKMLGEMDDWEKSTNLLAGFEGIPGARAGMGNLMGRAGWDLENSGAAAAFKIGYIGSTAFLDHKLGGP